VYTAGYQFGLGICVNDGDTGGEGVDLTESHTGQKGWSGWAPYGIVYGQNAESTGLATLVAGLLGSGIESMGVQWTSSTGAGDAHAQVTESKTMVFVPITEAGTGTPTKMGFGQQCKVAPPAANDCSGAAGARCGATPNGEVYAWIMPAVSQCDDTGQPTSQW
jgi:hypothetical protein